MSLRPYGEEDLWLLRRLLGDPEMTRYLGGPESPQALEARHHRYVTADPQTNGLFVILVGRRREPVGWAGFWESEADGEPVWECGWSVLPEAQGRGVATAAATLLLAEVRGRHRHRYLHAFPSVENTASNALSRRLGFELVGEVEVEYPKGHPMRCNDWRTDLTRGGARGL